MKNLQKGSARVLIIILVVVLVCIVGYVALIKKSPTTKQLQTNSSQNIEETTTTTSNRVVKNQNLTTSNETTDWKTYRNTVYNFGFKYPESAKLVTLPGNDTILSHNEVEFEKEGSFYNKASVVFFVYKKGEGKKSVVSQTYNSQTCKTYQQSSLTIDGKNADLVEYADCSGSEGSPTGGSGHKLIAIIPLSHGDLVYVAHLSNKFISDNDYGTKILNTVNF